MAKEHTEGNVDKASGKIKEGIGRATGDKDMEAEGHGEQAKGDLKKGVGDVKDAVRDATRK